MNSRNLLVATLLVVAAQMTAARLAVANDNPFINEETPEISEKDRAVAIVTVKVGDQVVPYAISDDHKAAVEEFKTVIALVGEKKLEQSDERVVKAQHAIDVLTGQVPAEEGKKAQVAEGVVKLEAKKDGIAGKIEEIAKKGLDKSEITLANEKSEKHWWRVGFGYGYRGFYGYGYGGGWGRYYGGLGYYGGYYYPYNNYYYGFYNPYMYGYGCNPCYNYFNYSYPYYGGYGGYGIYC